MRFSRVVDALDASGGKFENVYMYVCYVQRRVSCTSYHALRVLCPFSCLHFLSSVVVEISSVPSFSPSVSCTIFSASRQFPNSNSPWPTFEKEKKKKKKRELNIFCWWILSLVAWVSHYSFAILFYISLEKLILLSFYDYLKIMIKISNVPKN